MNQIKVKSMAEKTNEKKSPNDRLDEMRATATSVGGQSRIQAQHDKGKLTARERIAKLLDADTFNEVDMFRTHRANRFGMEKSQFPARSPR